jgi:hypothetical protein
MVCVMTLYLYEFEKANHKQGRMNLRIVLFLFYATLLVGASNVVFAQVYPVQASVQVQPPYSPYLTDYTSPGSQKLVLQLRANDITISDHPIKLRLTIEGLGITIRTKPNFIPQPLTLFGGGVPTILYGEDLYEYFNPNNLDFSGLSRTEFSRTGKLPEGLYRFSIEVLSYNREVQLSNRAFTTAWIILNDPPMLNLPRQDTKVKILDPTNIAFTWTPRHTGSPNSAFSTEYFFKIVEIWPENRNPYDAFLSQPALYEETTTQTQIVYGMANPALLLGRKYGWQVQARDVDGKDLFKNQGKSEVYVFQFGDALGAPENIKQEISNATTVNLSWELPSQGAMPQTYRIRYRKKGTTDNTWYESTTDQRWITLSSLQSNTNYEVQVRSEAKPQVSDYSAVQYAHTSEESTLPYTCGNESATPDLGNTSPLLMLRAGDVIAANNFKVIVAEAKGANGIFEGKGVMAVPFFNMANVNVIFSGIQINDKYQLVVGEILTTYNPGSELARKVEAAHEIGEEKPEVPQTSDSDSLVTSAITLQVLGVIDSVYFDAEKGEIVVVDEEGNTTTYEQKKDEKTGNAMETIVVDSAGNQYTVTPDGKVVRETGGSTSALASANGSKNPVNFKQASDQSFGFDQLIYEAHADSYGKENINESEFLIAWKSVASGGTDKVIAWSDKMENLFNEVNFQSLNGDLPKRKNESLVELTVTGIGHEQISEVEAYIKDPSDESKKVIIGRLNVIGYDPIVRNLVLVPVNGAAIPSQASLGQELNKIFSPAIVTWNISTRKNINVGLGSDGKLNDGSSGLLSNYTDEMRAVIRSFKNDHDIEDETYYLFFVQGGETGDKSGYMPRKKQCGFIFTGNTSSQNLAKTVAHELGHGAFRLEHTFETYRTLSKGTTDNLMDYGTGSRLHKYQWDLIHNPVAVWGLFEGDEEGASFCTWWHQNIVSYVSPSVKDEKLEDLMPLFQHVHGNFVQYHRGIKANNLEVAGFVPWTVRKASLTKNKTNLIPVESIFKKLVDGKSDDFNAWANGIFLGVYRIENQDFKVAVYSIPAKFGVDKTQVDDLCDLVDHEVIKIIIEDDYVIISFFKADELKMAIQIDGGDDETAKLWLKYLGILVEGPSVSDQISAFWNSFWESEDQKVDSSLPDVTLAENVTFYGYSSSDGQGCFRRSKEMLESAGFEPVGPADTSVVQMTKYNDSGELTVQDNAKKGIEIINEHLDAGRPIVVGVDWKSSHTGNFDETTDHWIIIVGRIKDGNNTCYQYFDPQTSQADIGTSPNNKLCLQENGTLTGRYRENTIYDRTYTVTMVRPSNPK